MEDSKDDFECVMRYSPLHNVQAPRSPAEALPSTLITTADHDDRVSPLHSYKMAATLQEVAGASPHQSRPLLIRIETKAGHGAGELPARPLSVAIPVILQSVTLQLCAGAPLAVVAVRRLRS